MFIERHDFWLEWDQIQFSTESVKYTILGNSVLLE